MSKSGHRVFAPGFGPAGGSAAGAQINLAAITAGYLAAYVFLDWASSMHALQGLAITPWNPQGGLSLTLLLLFGLRFAPLLALSALIGDVVVRQLPAPLYAAGLAAMAPAIGYAGLAWLLRRRWPIDLGLRSVRDLAFLLAGGLVATAFVALATASIYVGFRALPATSFADAALRYWIGDYIGIVVLTPFLLRLPRIRWRIRRRAEVVVLGSKQQWWLEPALAGLPEWALYFGATALTAITDNAALTYLGSLVPDVSEGFKYALVAGAITGGGLTVIANAPNPAGFSILKGTFEDETISPAGLFVAALPATLVTVCCFQYAFFASLIG